MSVAPKQKGRKMNVCIYHKNCQDGFVAALAVWMKYGDIRFIEAQYGDKAPSVKDDSVIIVDFSYPRDVLEKMKAEAAEMVVIDHHKTAQADLAGLDYCIFNMEKSGAVLTWEYLFPDKEIPKLFLYAQDRDLWKWEMPHSREVSAALRIQPKDFERWRHFCNVSVLDRLIPEGQAILAYQNQCVDSIAKSNEIPEIKINGYSVPIINCTHLLSETIGRLAVGKPFAIGYFDTKDKRIFSLRSAPDGVDVAEIAKQHGGGGHKHAAGFTRPKPDLAI